MTRSTPRDALDEAQHPTPCTSSIVHRAEVHYLRLDRCADVQATPDARMCLNDYRALCSVPKQARSAWERAGRAFSLNRGSVVGSAQRVCEHGCIYACMHVRSPSSESEACLALPEVRNSRYERQEERVCSGSLDNSACRRLALRTSMSVNVPVN